MNKINTRRGKTQINRVGQVLPDNTPMKVLPSVYTMREAPSYCQVEPDLLKRHWLSKGFTLIELLVVVLIIGILAAVAMPQYQKAVEKSRTAEALTVLDALYKGYQLCVLENGEDLNVCVLNNKNNEDNLFNKTDIPLPLDSLTGNDCLDGIACLKNEYWDFGIDTANAGDDEYGEPIYEGIVMANRQEGQRTLYYLTLWLKSGKILCQGGKGCKALCGAEHCSVK